MTDPSSQTIGSVVYFDLCSTLLVKLLFHLQNGLLTPDMFTDTNVTRVSPIIHSISSSIEFTDQFTEDLSLYVVLYSPWPCSRESRQIPDIQMSTTRGWFQKLRVEDGSVQNKRQAWKLPRTLSSLTESSESILTDRTWYKSQRNSSEEFCHYLDCNFFRESFAIRKEIHRK